MTVRNSRLQRLLMQGYQTFAWQCIFEINFTFAEQLMSKMYKKGTFGKKVWNISLLYSVGNETVLRTDKKCSIEM